MINALETATTLKLVTQHRGPLTGRGGPQKIMARKHRRSKVKHVVNLVKRIIAFFFSHVGLCGLVRFLNQKLTINIDYQCWLVRSFDALNVIKLGILTIAETQLAENEKNC